MWGPIVEARREAELGRESFGFGCAIGFVKFSLLMMSGPYRTLEWCCASYTATSRSLPGDSVVTAAGPLDCAAPAILARRSLDCPVSLLAVPDCDRSFSRLDDRGCHLETRPCSNRPWVLQKSGSCCMLAACRTHPPPGSNGHTTTVSIRLVVLGLEGRAKHTSYHLALRQGAQREPFSSFLLKSSAGWATEGRVAKDWLAAGCWGTLFVPFVVADAAVGCEVLGGGSIFELMVVVVLCRV